MNWEDLKIIHAIAGQGSIRGAAKKLEVHHTTISRRLEAFESQMGIRLFDRLPQGYTLNNTGEDLLLSIERIDEEVNQIHRRLEGKDRKLSGEIRVTIPPSMGSHFLMPILKEFMNQYPDVEVEILSYYDTANLNKREADIAVRITTSPPEYLVGRKVAKYCVTNYATPEYLATHDLINNPSECHWIGWGEREKFPEWVKESAYPQISTRGQINNDVLQYEAVKAGLGIGVLGCFIGDASPYLSRTPLGTPISRNRNIWILTHKDLMRSTRIRIFMDWLTNAFQKNKDLFEGRLG